MKVALTGAGGFLGFHTHAAARSLGYTVDVIGLGQKLMLQRALAAIEGSSRLIHLAGVNRGSDQDIREGNIGFAQQLAEVLRQARTPPSEVVYANSIQEGNGSVYGEAKAEAAEVLKSAADDVGAAFTNVALPNLFGEYGKPFYNSVVATFCHLLHEEQIPAVVNDKELTLLHAQDAADLLLGTVALHDMNDLTTSRTVSAISAQLQAIATTYRNGDIPALHSTFDLNLFNTYRSFRLDNAPELPFILDRRADTRGSFYEVCRSQGGAGQTSFSTTVPGVTRGQHFHRRKVERFVVLSGKAQISMRGLLSDEVLKFDVDGSSPVAVDMPTLWSHKITNTGESELYTMFWTNEIFDPARPDTFAEEV